MKEQEIGTLSWTKKPQILSNLKKGNFCRTSYQFFKDWDERSDDERENINPTEKMATFLYISLNGVTRWFPLIPYDLCTR